MRLGIFGGSFDPVHYGHLLLAENCREACNLDRVWFLPAFTPPHKQNQRLATANQRVDMLHLAIAGHSAFDVSTLEIERGGVNYTADTLETIAQQNPEATLFFLMGADSLAEFPTWRDPQRILAAAIPIVVRRSGSPEPDFRLLDGLVEKSRMELILQHQVESPLIELSSSDLRDRRARGLSIRYRTPRAVEKYLQAQRLYRTPDAE
ncbi:nicotinate-nucleotide adenylyltransferase [Lignipirellula cremea]|uniref:Probable nicotinate-nucleotide adenylyltransferase n=1 Tax=Lignipirellula cremea TaxID=2528010 RepID=A0A518E1R7_9BACT|nr:nicotinate-nucleotide adenylyltransferase [Lignipirellula cremea]QDU98013.1 Nicotinate-nucleotide adenylyltransferase [Lignipirellula cremea]